MPPGHRQPGFRRLEARDTRGLRQAGGAQACHLRGRRSFERLLLRIEKVVETAPACCRLRGQENVASRSGRGVYLRGAMFHHSLALERRTSKERLERRLSKESESALLEANLKAKDGSPALHLESSPVSTIPNLPSENDLQSLASAKSASIHGRSTPSESSRRRQKHTTFADQKQQQLEHMCAAASPRRGLAPAPHLALAVRPSPASRPRYLRSPRAHPVQMLRAEQRRAHLARLLQD